MILFTITTIGRLVLIGGISALVLAAYGMSTAPIPDGYILLAQQGFAAAAFGTVLRKASERFFT